MPTNITVTNPALNEIVVSSSYLQGAGSVNRLGPAQIEHTSATNALSNDIFFKFYRCSDTGGTKVYSALDISASIADSTIESQFLTMLFTQYYGDSIIVNDIGGSFPDIAERLSGIAVGSQTTNLSSTTNRSIRAVAARVVGGSHNFDCARRDRSGDFAWNAQTHPGRDRCVQHSRD